MRPCTCLNALRPLARPVRSLPKQLHPFSRSGSSSTPSPPATEATPATPAATSAPLSSCPAGTKLTGLNYLKTGTDPVAMEDSEYPAWLWEILAVKAVDSNATAAGRLEAAAKELRVKGKKGIKTSNSLKTR